MTTTTEKPKKSNRGGRRPGSGRPRLHPTEKRISKLLLDRLEHLADKHLLNALEDLLKGVQVMQVDKKGNSRVYIQPPNPQIVMYVADRVLGKMPNRTEVTGGKDDDGNERPIPILLLPPLEG